MPKTTVCVSNDCYVVDAANSESLIRVKTEIVVVDLKLVIEVSVAKLLI